ncbi:MAG: anhydro-N-acetylmuramic acid kinase [Cyclobacteriaceae bacterium]|nr:anhydro-N-acetylmuramic acid kinase [Cyclobacteriaceae bacterium]
MKKIQAIGVMSGSSLDGLDICGSNYILENGQWRFDVLAATGVAFPDEIHQKLAIARQLSGMELTQLDHTLGQWMAESIAAFIGEHQLQPDVIGSHGHTVFHQPKKGYTLQIGNGHRIALHTGCQTVTDFRTQDILLGGEGAPLVPVGDRWLFGGHDSYLNLGGIANVSIVTEGKWIAGDVAACNQVLNSLAAREGMRYDAGGELAASGKMKAEWQALLEADTFYDLPFPKSISNEWVYEKILRVLPQDSTRDLLHTYTRFSAKQIANVLKDMGCGNVFVTGGGAHNDFLMDCIREYSGVDVIVPSKEIVNYKEAIIFGFLAVLRVMGIPNSYAAITGSARDHCAGTLFIP